MQSLGKRGRTPRGKRFSTAPTSLGSKPVPFRLGLRDRSVRADDLPLLGKWQPLCRWPLVEARRISCYKNEGYDSLWRVWAGHADCQSGRLEARPCRCVTRWPEGRARTPSPSTAGTRGTSAPGCGRGRTAGWAACSAGNRAQLSAASRNGRANGTREEMGQVRPVPFVARPEFYPLNVPAFFRAVKVDAGGHGVSWNDDLDLSEYELCTNGKAAADDGLRPTLPMPP